MLPSEKGMTEALAREIVGVHITITYRSREDWLSGKAWTAELGFNGRECSALFHLPVPVEDVELVAPCSSTEFEEVEEEGKVPYTTGHVNNLVRVAEYFEWAPPIVEILRETRESIEQGKGL
jgi:hypothetical protein